MNPLTHHEILTLVAPFTRSGRQVDLGSSDRPTRRLAFKAIEHAAEDPDAAPGASDATSNPARALAHGLPPLREQLTLENTSTGWFSLTRTLTLPDGQRAELVCEGVDPSVLWDAVRAVPARRQLLPAQGQLLVWSHRLDAASGRLILTHAAASVAALQLTMKVSRVKGISAELELSATQGESFDLPEDLIAVLGLPWSRLSPKAAAWHASIVLRGSDVQRTRDAEAKFARTATHLALVVAGTPAQFHQRFRGARWAMVLRRLTPLLVATGLIVGALLVPQLNLGQDSVFRMLIFNAPPLLLVWLFTLREIPRLEIPPLPRPPAASGWHASGTAPPPSSTTAPH